MENQDIEQATDVSDEDVFAWVAGESKADARDRHLRYIHRALHAIEDKIDQGEGTAIDRMLKLIEREAKLRDLDEADSPAEGPKPAQEAMRDQALGYLAEIERGRVEP